jgi:hypothetical protein
VRARSDPHIVVTCCTAHARPMRTGHPPRAVRLAGIAFVGLLISCSGRLTPGAASSSSSSPGATGVAASETSSPGGVEPPGGEGSLVRFVHSSGWRVDSPGPMTSSSAAGAVYQGLNDFLRVSSLAGSSDPARVAAVEAASPTGPGFQLVKGPHRVSVGGKSAVEYEYREDAPPSPATGQAGVLRAVRLYVARPGGMYRVEYGSMGPASSWDPQGASDIVSTFRTGA